MVGRGNELDVLTRLLSAAKAGTGGTLLITGEAGIGKTRLLAEVTSLAEAENVFTLVGRSVVGSGPFRPLVEALLPAASSALADDDRLLPYRSVLGRLLPGWPDLAGSDARLVDPVVILGEAVLALVRAIAGPGAVVVALDDLHWADPDSFALLGYLAGRVTTFRCCWSARRVTRRLLGKAWPRSADIPRCRSWPCRGWTTPTWPPSPEGALRTAGRRSRVGGARVRRIAAAGGRGG